MKKFTFTLLAVFMILVFRGSFTVSAEGPVRFQTKGPDGDPNDIHSQTVDVEMLKPEISVKVGSTKIKDGDTTPSLDDGTDFGVVPMGSDKNRKYYIYNNGFADLLLDGDPKVVISGPQAADFTVIVYPNGRIPPRSFVYFEVKFKPSELGLRTATITIPNNDADEDPYDFAIQGTGVPNEPEMDVRWEEISIPDGDTTPSTGDGTDFGEVGVTSGTATFLYTIWNTGVAPLYLDGDPKVRVVGPLAADFAVVEQPGSPVDVGGAVQFQVEFDPSGPGLRTATLTIPNSDPDEDPYDFHVQGTGISVNEAEMNLRWDKNGISILDGDTSPSIYHGTDFGEVGIKGERVRRYIIYNLGDLGLTLTGDPRVIISGPNAADFKLIEQPAQYIEPGDYSFFDIKFLPHGLGTRTATLTIPNSDPDEDPYDFTIQGTGVRGGPEIFLAWWFADIAPIPMLCKEPLVTPLTIFGDVLVGSGTYRYYWIQNTGTSALILDGNPLVQVIGEHAADFTVTRYPDPVISPGSVWDWTGGSYFRVDFIPTELGVRNARISIENNDRSEDPCWFAIMGKGINNEPEIELRWDENSAVIPDGSTTPSPINGTDFGELDVNSGSASRLYRIWNFGYAQLHLDGDPKVSVSGPHAADFVVTQQPGSPIDGYGNSAQFWVEFNPSGLGIRTATITIPNNDADENPYDIVIQGEGILGETEP